MKETVDRIVNGKAVLIDLRGRQKLVEVKKLPKGLREGDILLNGKIDRRETSKSKTRVKTLLNQIFGNKKPAR